MNETEKVTDAELLRLIQRGDHDAFSQLYLRYWDRLFAVAYHRIKDQSDAEEVVQEVFLSLWRRREEVEIHVSVSNFMATAVKYQVINLLAKKRVRRKYIRLEARHPDIYNNPTEQWLSERELMVQIQKNVSLLPERCRLVFELSRNEGKSNKQIAQKLQITEKAVEYHITKALRRLRKNLGISIRFLPFFLF